MFKTIRKLTYALLVRQLLDDRTRDALKVVELQKQTSLLKKGNK